MAENQKPLTFILSDESINSYGCRILTSGVDMSLFKKNPIMLWNHFRAWMGKKDEVLPIGRWENVRKEGAQILGDAIFDEKDEFAQAVKSKVEQKILNMVSIGIGIISTSEDKSVLIPGQTRPTIIKSLLREASICDIASNRNAIKLYDEFGSELNLSDSDENHLLPLLTNNESTENQMNLNQQVAAALNLKEAVSDELLLSQIQTLGKELTDLRAMEAARMSAETKAKEVAVVNLVDDAIKARKITADDRENYLTLSRSNFDSAKAILDKMPTVVDLSETHGLGEKIASFWDKRFAETGQIAKN